MRKIAVISPVTNIGKTANFYQQQLNLSEIDFTMLGIEGKLSGIANAFDYALITPQIIRTAYMAAEAGAKAIIINCATEPGIIACRELLTIPVFGISEISLAKAAQQNKKFAILTPFFHADYKSLLENKIRALGYTTRCVDIIEIDIQNNTEETMRNIKQAMLVATKLEVSSVVIYSGYLLQYKNLIKQCLTTTQQLIKPLKASIEFVANLICP